MSCCNGLFLPPFCKEINTVIDNLELEDYQKNILKQRYVNIVNFYQSKAMQSGKYNNIFRTTVTTGSLLLPALLSIQQIGNENTNNIIYWVTWGLSICVTTANGFIQLFKIDKKYLSYSMVSEKLKSEGWLYFQLSGKYENSTHKNSFNRFCEKIEKIKMKQVTFDFTELQKSKSKQINNNDNNFLIEKQNDIENIITNKMSNIINNKMSNMQNDFNKLTSNITSENLSNDNILNNILLKHTNSNIIENNDNIINDNIINDNKINDNIINDNKINDDEK